MSCSRIIRGCLGFCGSGFSRNCSHCRKVDVTLCLGPFSGHTLANPGSSLMESADPVTLQDGTHPTFITEIRCTVGDPGFMMDHLPWASERFGTKGTPSGQHTTGNGIAESTEIG